MDSQGNVPGRGFAGHYRLDDINRFGIPLEQPGVRESNQVPQGGMVVSAYGGNQLGVVPVLVPGIGASIQVTPGGTSASAYGTNQLPPGGDYYAALYGANQLPPGRCYPSAYEANQPQPRGCYAPAYGVTHQPQPTLYGSRSQLPPSLNYAAESFGRLSLNNPQNGSTYTMPGMHDIQVCPQFTSSRPFSMSTVPYQHGTGQVAVGIRQHVNGHQSPLERTGQDKVHVNALSSLGHQHPLERNHSYATGVTQSPTYHEQSLTGLSSNYPQVSGTGSTVGTGPPPLDRSCSHASGVTQSTSHHEHLTGLSSSYSQTSRTGSAALKKPLPDLSFVDYVSGNGPLTEWFDLFIGQKVLLANGIGARTVRGAYCYVIDTYRCGKSWGGLFDEDDLKMKNGEDFFIDKVASLDANVQNLLLDCRRLTLFVIKHLKDNKSTAIYAGHLDAVFENPPSIIFQSQAAVEIFLDFVEHHMLFAFSTPRAHLISSFGKLLDYSGYFDNAKIKRCLKEASYTLDTPSEWWLEVALFPILKVVYWDDVPKTMRSFPSARHECNECGLFKYCRHSIVHGPEKSFGTVKAPPSAVAAPQLQSGPAQMGTTVTAQHTSASAGTVMPSPTAVAPELQSGAVQMGATVLPQHTSPSAGSSQMPAYSAQGTSNAGTSSPEFVRVQRMPSPVHLEYMLAKKFDVFIADSICRILLEPDVELVEFIQEPWRAYKRSGFNYDVQSQQ